MVSMNGNLRGVWWGTCWAVGILLWATVLPGCAGKQVSRVGTDTTIDLSGNWNDTDSRLVAEEMITDCLARPWITQHLQQSGGKLPVMIVGGVRNRSTEHIPVGTFLKDLERALINSGEVQVVADPTERGDLRLERADQWENASPETVKQLGQELGADFMLTGTIETITDEEGGEKVLFYQVDLNLSSIETNLKVWAGQHKIKKYVGMGKYKP
jgi:penicillin-binding protein activator